MPEINPPFALQNAGATHTAENDRMMLSGLLAGQRGAGTQLTARGGVHPMLGSQMNVTQTGTPSMAVQVFSGVCYIPGTESSKQGIYACTNDASKTVAVPTAHGSLPRIDLVVARVYDSAYSGGSDTWVLEVIQGTAASSPSEPALPNNSLRLAAISVGAGVVSITNANISDRRTYVTSVGGIITCRDDAELNTYLTLVPEGQGAFRRDNGVLYFKFGGVWVPRSQQQILISNQISSPPFNVVGTYVDFTSGAWPAITFTAPASGRIRVTVSAAVSNSNTGGATSWATYRISGAITVSASESNGLSAAGTRVYAERSRVYGGLTPGASCTVTPQWNISSGNSSTAVCVGGQLQVELLP